MHLSPSLLEAIKKPHLSHQKPLILFCAAVALMFFVPALRADLLVIPADNGASSATVFRFDDRTGALIDEFGHESEGYEGIVQGPDEKIYVTSNILGYGDVYRF